MSEDAQARALEQLFADTDAELSDPDFTHAVMTRTDQAKRWRIARRIGLGCALALLGIPLQDFGLALAQVLVVSLIELEGGLVAQLLAPVNTVGSLLSAIILMLRIVHRRLTA